MQGSNQPSSRLIETSDGATFSERRFALRHEEYLSMISMSRQAMSDDERGAYAHGTKRSRTVRDEHNLNYGDLRKWLLEGYVLSGVETNRPPPSNDTGSMSLVEEEEGGVARVAAKSDLGKAPRIEPGKTVDVSAFINSRAADPVEELLEEYIQRGKEIRREHSAEKAKRILPFEKRLQAILGDNYRAFRSSG